MNPDFRPSDLPAYVGSPEKLDADLRGLLALALLAGEKGGCRRADLARHFELPKEPPCSACDACAEADDWLEAHIVSPARPIG